MKEIFDIKGMAQESVEGDPGLNIIAANKFVCCCLASRPELMTVVYKHLGSEVNWILLSVFD